MPNPTVLASDIDNTLTGDAVSLDALSGRLSDLRARRLLVLLLVTGRRLEQVIEGWRDEGLPDADAVVSQVGTEIYLPPYGPDDAPLAEWDERLRRHFDREEALGFLEGIEGLEMQPDRFNTPLKVSCYLDEAPDPDAAADVVRQRVRRAGNGYQVVWSSGRDLDILPSAAGKGNAIRYLIERLNLSPERVLVAGDSGNDTSMFDAFHHGIVVANAQSELRDYAAARSDDGLYVASRPYAAGVAEGLEHFGVL